jgi:hypothetical protein
MINMSVDALTCKNAPRTTISAMMAVINMKALALTVCIVIKENIIPI